MDIDKVPEDLRFWYSSLLDDKQTYFNAPVVAVRDLIERIATLQSRVQQLEEENEQKESCIAKICEALGGNKEIPPWTRVRGLHERVQELERDLASTEESLDAQRKKYEDCPHPKPLDAYGEPTACACSYDKASDVCALHAPQLKKALSRVQELTKRAERAERLFDGEYMDWGRAGGPNECKHGYAEGIPCRACDMRAYIAEKQARATLAAAEGEEV